MERKSRDLTKDNPFGRLTVIARDGRNNRGKVLWLCLCECGNYTSVIGGNLFHGSTRSCGCLKKEWAQKLNKTHGMGTTPEYRSWAHMKDRCYNKNDQAYKYYGARGITVCPRWKNSFENFITDMGFRPSASYSIDRINNNGDYEQGNCRWATHFVQMANRRTNLWFYAISPEGLRFKSKCQSQFARDHGLFGSGISRCISGQQESYKGWQFKAALKSGEVPGCHLEQGQSVRKR